MIYASLYHINSTLPHLQDQKEKWPEAPNRDGLHILFADTHKDADPVYISDLTNGDNKDSIAWAIAKLLVYPENIDVVLCGTYAQFNELHRHPAWQIWCGNYDVELDGDGRDLFVSDWAYIKNMISEYMPEAEGSWPEMSDSITYSDGREIIFNAVSQNAGE